MTTNHFTIRSMSRAEVQLAVDWAAQEGWNPGLQDVDSYRLADPEGFLMGFLDEEPIGSISVMRYGDSFGFLGFYIVKPEYRGQGYGIQIWNAGLEYLAGRNIGLDGVVEQQENYKKSGFALAHRNIRYEGVGGGNFPESSELVSLTELPFEQVAIYSQPFFPEDRSAFNKAWINQTGATAFGVIQQGKLSGYGVIRPCVEGYKIAPLFADSTELAELLFQALSSTVGASDKIYLDLPEVNQAAVALAELHGMEVVFETARMYTKKMPEMPLARIFGLTSFEVG